MTHTLRQPVVAGRFYEADANRCAADAAQLCAADPFEGRSLPDALFGGIVPHAGWVCSGRIAGLVWRALAERSSARTVFLTGSVHTIDLPGPALDSFERWRTPLGDIEVDAALREAIEQLDGFETIDDAHVGEHALEVELPLIQQAFGDELSIVPCMIPPHIDAANWGNALGELLLGWPAEVLVVASSDLTHYGPSYGFTPAGVGEQGRRWAHDDNDRSLLDRVEMMRTEGLVERSVADRSACGGGAIAAVTAAASRLGAERGYVLEHTDSTTELAKIGHADPNNSVGYAAVVYG
jgi:AmmeMemoRadiSam system protein B